MVLAVVLWMERLFTCLVDFQKKLKYINSILKVKRLRPLIQLFQFKFKKNGVLLSDLTFIL